MTNSDLYLEPNLTQSQLMEKAEAGHPTAQYAIAKQKQAEGNEAESLKWMRKSADGNLFAAQYELGMWHLLGHLVEFDPDKALALIGKAVDANHTDAMRLMAVLHGIGFAVEKSWEKAVDYILRAADFECPHSLRQIAFLLLKTKGMKKTCEKLITRAATFDEVICLAYLGKNRGEVKSEEIPEGWDGWGPIREALLSLDGKADYSARELSKNPDIQIFEGALSPEETLYIKTMAAPALTPDVQVLGGNPNDPVYQKLQNNSVMVFFPIIQDLFIIQIVTRLAALSGNPAENAELPMVHHYATGQEFKEHVDYMDPENHQQAFSIQQTGQRIKSVFAYLNEGYEGGETFFPEIDLKVKGKEGDVLVIDNMDAIGLPNEKTRHAGLRVERGEKFLMALWVRDRNQVS